MYPLTVKEICDLTQGTVHGDVNPDAVIDGCVIDSRDVQSGDAFFALAGQKSHGMRFASAALSDGAEVVIVAESLSQKCNSPHVAVEDPEIALAQIAQLNRRKSDALVIGITGSVGKTTTRCLIASILQSIHDGIQSPRNFNNHLGVPLSVLELQEGDEFAAIEIGASAPGEVGVLSAIAEPELAVITRVTPSHLQGFGSLRAVQAEKQQLLLSLSDTSTAFLNADDPLVAEMAAICPGRVVTFGCDASAEIRADSVTPSDHRLLLRVDGIEYDVPLCGRHNATNVLAAIAVGLETGVPPEQIQEVLRNFEGPSARCRVRTIGDLTVIDDTYNSSPASVAAAIQTAEEFEHCGRRVVALGDMLDLGEQAADLHYGIGAALATSGIDHVAVTGNFADAVVEGFLATGGHLSRISEFRSLQLMTSMLECVVGEGDLLLVKGSRATQMERLIRKLEKSAATTAATEGHRRAA